MEPGSLSLAVCEVKRKMGKGEEERGRKEEREGGKGRKERDGRGTSAILLCPFFTVSNLISHRDESSSPSSSDLSPPSSSFKFLLGHHSPLIPVSISFSASFPSSCSPPSSPLPVHPFLQALDARAKAFDDVPDMPHLVELELELVDLA